MFAGLKIRLTNNEGDGLRLITLMGFGLVAGLVSLWCGWQLAPRDTTARYVPQTAAAYLHASGSENPLALPGGWSADEIARFILADDGRLEPGAILVWKNSHAPTADEMTRLEMDGWRLGQSTWLIADAAPAQAVFAALRDGRTIAESPIIARALGRANQSFPMQGLIVPSALPSDSLRDSLKSIQQLPTLVLGWEFRGRTVNGMALPLMPSESASPNAADFQNMPTALRADDRLLIGDATQAFNPLPVFFATLENSRQKEGFSLSANATKARRDLSDRLMAPHTLSVSSTGDDGRLSITAAYPTVKPVDMKAAIKAYLDSLIPAVIPAALPDQTNIKEIVWGDNSDNNFYDKPGGISSLTVPKAEISLYLAPFEQNGTVLSTAYPPNAQIGSNAAAPTCTTRLSAQMTIDHKLWLDLLKLSSLGTYFDSGLTTPINLGISVVDGIMIICGQPIDTVDKL